MPEIGATAVNAQGQRIRWNGNGFDPVTASTGTPDIPVGKIARNAQGQRIAWDGKQFVPVQPSIGGIAERGLRQGMADLVSLPNTLGNLAAMPGNPQQPLMARGMPAQFRDVPANDTLQSVGSAVAANTPSREELMARAERNVGPMADAPTQASGRLLEAGIRGGTAGAVGGPIGIAGGVTSGVAQQGSAELGAPEWVQVMAGIGVPGATSLGYAGLKALARSTPQRIMDRAVADLTPSQAASAKALMDSVPAGEAPLTLAEAASIVSGHTNTRLLNLQRIIEQSPGGQPIMTPFMAQRIEGNRAAAGRVMDTVAPPISGEARTMVPQNLQTAAEGAESAVKSVRTVASSPIYKSVTGPGDNLTPAAFQPLTDDPAIAASIKAVRNDPAFERMVKGLPDNNMAVLDAAYKNLSDDIAVAAKDARGTRAAFLTDAREVLKDAMENEFPDYAVARKIHEDMSRQIDPTLKGPVGQLAGQKKPDVGSQADILTPMNPDTLDPAMVRQTIRQLNAQDPTAAQTWLRVNLEAQFDKAARQRKGNTEQWAGAQFASNVAGNEKQARNLRAMIEETSGTAAADGFDNWLKIMQAQGRRQAPGSMTEWNKLDVEDLKAGRIPIGLVRPKAEFTDWWTRRKFEQNSEVLAQWLTGEDAKAILSRLADVPTNSRQARFLYGAAAASFMNVANQAEQTEK